MNEAAPYIIALFFMVTTVICGVNWAFDAYEKTRLQNEEHKIFIQNLGINESLEKDKCFLENELRPYKDLAHLYKCNNAEELHFLIRELETKLYYKNHNMKEKE